MSDSGFRMLDSGFRILDTVAGCWLLVAGCWLLVAGCWLLVAGYMKIAKVQPFFDYCQVMCLNLYYSTLIAGNIPAIQIPRQIR